MGKPRTEVWTGPNPTDKDVEYPIDPNKPEHRKQLRKLYRDTHEKHVLKKKDREK